MKIKLSKKWIGENSPVFVIAEAGINHNGSLKIGKKLIIEAKKAGADAIKFQTFKADDLASRNSNFFKLFKKLELSDHEFMELSKFAKKNNIIFLSTPFSNQAVDLLMRLKVPAFKIASGDLTHIPLIKYAASKKKPMIISTGMANIVELNSAIKAIRSCNNNKILIMHSVSSYPTPVNETNLSVINQLQKKYQYPIGFSDNGAPELAPILSVALGAKLIEKHFTINKKMKGPDHRISFNPTELKNMIKQIRLVEKMMGDGKKICQPSEIKNRIAARRSITANSNIDKNETIKKKMISIKRPAKGIEPRFFNKVLGKKTKRRIAVNEPIKWKDIR